MQAVGRAAQRKPEVGDLGARRERRRRADRQVERLADAPPGGAARRPRPRPRSSPRGAAARRARAARRAVRRWRAPPTSHARWSERPARARRASGARSAKSAVRRCRSSAPSSASSGVGWPPPARSRSSVACPCAGVPSPRSSSRPRASGGLLPAQPGDGGARPTGDLGDPPARVDTEAARQSGVQPGRAGREAAARRRGRGRRARCARSAVTRNGVWPSPARSRQGGGSGRASAASSGPSASTASSAGASRSSSRPPASSNATSPWPSIPRRGAARRSSRRRRSRRRKPASVGDGHGAAERRLALQPEIDAQPAGVVDQPAIAHLELETRRGARPQLGRERQPQLAPGRRQLDFRGAQDDLPRPRQELQAAPPRRARPSVSKPASSTRPSTMRPRSSRPSISTLLDPAAQELARTVTDLQAREAMIRRRAEPQAATARGWSARAADPRTRPPRGPLPAGRRAAAGRGTRAGPSRGRRPAGGRPAGRRRRRGAAASRRRPEESEAGGSRHARFN